MKPRLSPFFLLFSLMSVFFGCTTDIVRQPADMAAAREAAPVEEAPSEAVTEKPEFQGPSILGITVIDEPDSQVIDVEADRPLVFTMYKPSDPFQVVVELTAADLGSNTERILVDRDSILDIVPTQVESPSRMARLEIGLTAPLAITPRVEGNHLLLEVPRLAPIVSAEQEEPVSAAEEVAALSAEIAAEEQVPAIEVAEEAEVEAEPEPMEEELPEPEVEIPAAVPSLAVKGVFMDSEDDLVNVRIMTDGEVSPEVYAIGGRKIIVDIPGVESLEKGSVPEVIAPVQRIRTGTYRGKARIVIDLFMESKYDVTSTESGVSVTMPKPPPVKVAAKPVEAAEAPGMEEMEKIVPATDMAEPGEVTPVTLMQPRKKYSGQKISLDFQDAEVVHIYRLLADVAGYNLVVHPEVKGKIPNLKLENVPWDQALEIVLKLSGQGSVIEGNILRIAPQEVFARENEAVVKAREARQKAEELYQRIIAINYADAGEIRTAIEQSKILSPRGNITIDTRMNTLIIQDVQDSIDKIIDLVRIMDIAKPQVLIEARMVTVRTTVSKDLGIDWTGVFNASAETGVTTGLRFPNDISGSLATNVGLGAVEPTLTLALGSVSDIFTLNLQIAALEEGNEGRTLSNPKVMTMDNEEAEVKQGTKIPYKTISDKGTETAFVDATLSLKVTPRITPGGYVQLKILATRNAIGVTTPDGPAIDLNEVTTQALVRDGDTIVLGGIYTKDITGRETKVPVLGDIPLFGWLFKSTADTEEINELLIFITPRIVKGRVTL